MRRGPPVGRLIAIPHPKDARESEFASCSASDAPRAFVVPARLLPTITPRNARAIAAPIRPGLARTAPPLCVSQAARHIECARSLPWLAVARVMYETAAGQRTERPSPSR